MIVREPKQLIEVIDWLLSTNELVIDIETSGLNVRSCVVTEIAIGNGNAAFVLCMNEWTDDVFRSVLPANSVKAILRMLSKKKLVTWNGSYDTRVLFHSYGVELWPSLHADGMLAAHTLNENRFEYGLKSIAAEMGFDNSDQADMVKSIKANGGTAKEYYKADAIIRATYALGDVRKTWALWKTFESQLTKQGLLEFFNTEVMELYRHCTIPMELTGIPLDMPLLERSKAEIDKTLIEVEDRIQATIKPELADFHAWYIERKFPFKMSGEFKQKLAAKIAPPNWPMTKNGTYSFALADLKRAVKKGLLESAITEGKAVTNSLLEALHVGDAKMPEDLKIRVQLELLADSGVKYPFNILSKPHLKKLFFEHLGETATSFTDLGNPQVDDEFITLMTDKYPWAKDLQVFNRLTKIRGTYIDRFLDAQESGVFYPRLTQHRTVSGRYSGDTQQLPRPLEPGQDDPIVIEFNNRIRRFFISAPGWSYADFDYDSQEVKVFAHVSGEQKIKDIFARGDDFYSSVYLAAEGDTGEFSANKNAPNYLGKVNKSARQKAKSYALGLAFGMTPYKLKFELNCSESEATRIFNGYFAAYPALKQWVTDSRAFALEYGYMKTQAGRVRRYQGLKESYKKHGKILLDGLELWKEYNELPKTYAEMKIVASRVKNDLNNALNHQIQGLAASITNRAAVKTSKALKAAGLQARLCNVLHDQITVHCPDEELQETMEILQHCMETAYPISVPLTAPPSHGKNWAESK